MILLTLLNSPPSRGKKTTSDRPSNYPRLHSLYVVEPGPFRGVVDPREQPAVTKHEEEAGGGVWCIEAVAFHSFRVC